MMIYRIIMMLTLTLWNFLCRQEFLWSFLDIGDETGIELDVSDDDAAKNTAKKKFLIILNYIKISQRYRVIV